LRARLPGNDEGPECKPRESGGATVSLGSAVAHQQIQTA
jgi:hypothetical protein